MVKFLKFKITISGISYEAGVSLPDPDLTQSVLNVEVPDNVRDKAMVKEYIQNTGYKFKNEGSINLPGKILLDFILTPGNPAAFYEECCAALKKLGFSDKEIQIRVEDEEVARKKERERTFPV
jgi:hypothetical protein